MQDKTVQVDVKVTELAVCDNCIDLGVRGPLDEADIAAIQDLVAEWGIEFLGVISVDWDRTDTSEDSDMTCELCHSGDRDHLHLANATVISHLPDDILSF